MKLSHAAARVEGDAAQRLLGHWSTLLTAMADGLERGLSAVPMLTEAEQQTLLVMWNDTAADYPRGATLHGLFEAQVERTPEAVALVFEDEQLTYRDLDERANRLAHHLRALGVGPGGAGGAVPRALAASMVVGILGGAQGGRRLPAARPEYPAERLAFMLADAGAPVLLTQRALLGAAARAGRSRDVCLDRGRAPGAASATSTVSAPEAVVGPRDLAYVIYTSGSTGRPKGVMRAAPQPACGRCADAAALRARRPGVRGSRRRLRRHSTQRRSGRSSGRCSPAARLVGGSRPGLGPAMFEQFGA